MTNQQWKESATTLLTNNILPFWTQHMIDNRNGGFYGRIDGMGNLHTDAEKGAILNARILWAYAAAYRVCRNEEYLNIATRAKNYLIQHFLDREYGGIFWSLNADGTPSDTKKQTYAIGFAIYGLSEYARATGDNEALEYAISLFNDIEQHAFDPINCGYIEALTCEWKPIDDMRLSDKDENGSRTMNTHLHILEPYTNLYRVWQNPHLEQQLRTLINIFTTRLLNPATNHLDLFFNDHWAGKRDIESYGHDIEAAWLINEALDVLDDQQLTAAIRPVCQRIAQASMQGLQTDGSMVHESKFDPISKQRLFDMSRQWWVECETVIGFIDQYGHTSEERYLEIAQKAYDYILNRLVDREQGEWYWAILEDGTIDRQNDKAGFWKCPYHNSRMCLEIIERLK